MVVFTAKIAITESLVTAAVDDRSVAVRVYGSSTADLGGGERLVALGWGLVFVNEAALLVVIQNAVSAALARVCVANFENRVDAAKLSVLII